ncbi:hypothetical protein [Aeromonas hydrophila]|uniref:hypothetical protein n=1 Tax=Aeromonas hydrophila TaxID=644 RepID=UPI0023629D01|nr:hypothetical protein [Aeromonas hydrophila]
MNYLWIPSSLVFIPEYLSGDYSSSGWDLSGGKLVNEDVFNEFSVQPPAGKIRGVDVNGMPCWDDAPTIPNEDLLHDELQKISDQYKLDINELNQAYLAAIVSDGPGEVAKQAAVRFAIDERKAKYVADKASAREKYPV